MTDPIHALVPLGVLLPISSNSGHAGDYTHGSDEGLLYPQITFSKNFSMASHVRNEDDVNVGPSVQK